MAGSIKINGLMGSYAFRLGTVRSIFVGIRGLPMPVKDMKLLRDQLAKVIGENRSLKAKLGEANEKNAEQSLMVDRLALKLSLATAKLDEALAKIAKLGEALREVTGSKAKTERILQYYDNAHTPPRNRTISPSAR